MMGAREWHRNKLMPIADSHHYPLWLFRECAVTLWIAMIMHNGFIYLTYPDFPLYLGV